MSPSKREYSALMKLIRDQLDISQEDLARELGVSLASVNRWENGQTKPSKLAKAQLEAFCDRKVQEGSLDLAEPKQCDESREPTPRRHGSRQR